MRIKLHSDPKIRRVVPGYVWATQPFNFSPMGFGIEVGDQELVFTKDCQLEGVTKFCESPFGQQNFVITGYLDDQKALYLGAYLVQAHLKKGGTNPLWITLNQDPRDFQTLTKPTMLIVSNITAESTPSRFQKCRDLVYQFWDIPRVIIGCGLDPIRFGGQRLHIPVNKMVYFKSGLDAETIVVE